MSLVWILQWVLSKGFWSFSVQFLKPFQLLLKASEARISWILPSSLVTLYKAFNLITLKLTLNLFIWVVSFIFKELCSGVGRTRFGCLKTKKKKQGEKVGDSACPSSAAAFSPSSLIPSAAHQGCDPLCSRAQVLLLPRCHRTRGCQGTAAMLPLLGLVPQAVLRERWLVESLDGSRWCTDHTCRAVNVCLFTVSPC